MPKKIDKTLEYYRKALNGITIGEVNFPVLDGSPEDYRKFVAFCNDMYKNPFFRLIRDHLLNEQRTKTLQESLDSESLNYGRAVIASILFWEDVFKKYSDEYEDKFTVNTENFDPRRSFESVY